MGKSTMPKVTLIMDDELNKRTRKYINDTFPDSPYGRLKEVIEDALKEYLEKRKY